MNMDVYQALKDHFADDSRVTVNAGKGAQGIKVKVKNKDKMIIMFPKGDLLLQMPPATIQELIGRNRVCLVRSFPRPGYEGPNSNTCIRKSVLGNPIVRTCCRRISTNLVGRETVDSTLCS